MMFECTAIDFRQSELTPQQVEAFIIINPFVFPPVIVPKRFEGIGLSANDQAVPAMPPGSVTPFRHEVDSNSHTEGRHHQAVIPGFVVA